MAHPQPFKQFMQVIPFVAESASDAVAQIRAELGSDAVVLHVRQLPAEGLSRLWKSPRIEVLAYKPERKPQEPSSRTDEPAGMLATSVAAEDSAAAGAKLLDARPPTFQPSGGHLLENANRSGECDRWQIGEILERSGLLPKHVSGVMDAMVVEHGERPPATLAQELMLARAALKSLWRALPNTGQSNRGPHVLVGPPGAGKTTCICKWLTQARLIEGRAVQVWRLDGTTANTAESLSVYCEILGIPAERTWSHADAALKSDLSLIDLPGVDWRSPAAVRELARRLDEIGPARVHLVLNVAYEVPVLLAQARAFATLPIEDLIFTHLDEEPRWGKIWNVILGTKIPVRFFSAAQNIPGEFETATAEKILSRQFPA
jgi:flagellar biosynthesis protein FlhF